MACNGPTDDAPALKAAIAHAQAAGGAIVTIPAGTCVLGSAIAVGGSVPITLQGSGMSASTSLEPNGRTVLQAAGFFPANGTLLTIRDGTNVLQNMAIRDSSIDGNNVAGRGLYLSDNGFINGVLTNFECKNVTGTPGDCVSNTGHDYSMVWNNVIAHDSVRGALFQGEIQQTAVFGGKFYYNTGGANGQVRVGIMGYRLGPISFYGTDFESSPSTTGTNNSLVIQGALLACYSCYFESHGESNSTTIAVFPNANQSEPSIVNLIGGFALSVDGFYPFNYLEGAIGGEYVQSSEYGVNGLYVN